MSFDILKHLDIKEKIKLNPLDRYKTIRHDANYKGFRVSIKQAEDILKFWDKCSEDIIKIIKTKLN